MYILKFKVDKQYITRIDNEKPVGKCRNLFKAHFDFVGNEWSGTKTAIFKNEKVSKSVIIDESNECVVPWEFFNLKTTSIGLVSVFCGDLVTANAATVVIYESGYTDSDASVPPSPDVYQQILEKIDSISGLTTEDIKKAVEEYLTENPIAGEAREIELRKTEIAIQWRYVGEDTWKDLIQLSEIAGKDGSTPEIGKDGNWYINGQDTGKPSRGENATDEQVQQAVDTYMQNVDFDTRLAGKLDKYQGVENAGKALVVGEDGNVVTYESTAKVELDTTLTQVGKASEAKAVGDKFLQYAVKNTVSGTIPLIIEDSAEEPILDFKLFGKSEQLTTSGKNLFDPNINYEDYVWIRNDGEIVGGSNARTSDYIPVKQGKYAFQFDVPNPNQMFVAGYNTEKAFVKIVGIISKGKGTINIDDISIKTIRVSYTRESTRIQLEFSESPTPYEPYTGGKPSPSPEYPQKIKNVGKWNEEKQKYEVDIKVTGKNLFDGKYVIGSLDASNGEIFTANKDYGVTDFIEVIPKVDYCYNFRYSSGYKICQYDANKKFLTSNMAKTAISTSKTKFMRFQLYLGSDSVLKDNIKIEIGKTSTLYEPYREPQSLTLTFDRPITKWDKLVEQDGEIGRFYGGKIIDSYNNEPIHTEYISTTGELSVGATVLHKLKEVEFIPLPQSEQEAIRALTTYYPTTVITADGGEIDPNIKVTYNADTKNYIDQKIESITKSVVETQMALL